jgi:hypothetical protein
MNIALPVGAFSQLSRDGFPAQTVSTTSDNPALQWLTQQDFYELLGACGGRHSGSVPSS